ncbi:MAG TPA: hypothetical protein VG815_03645 [Chloroflexota bacterium]|jgi:hypothetical protein|nr:hypothetical protein [Chloroflexota bacterium]
MKRILLIGTFLAAIGPLASGTVQAAHAQSANHTAPSPYTPARRESLSQMPASLAAAVRGAIPPSSGPYFSTGDFFPRDGANGDQFGYAVALSANGDVAMVGASQKEINGTLNGNKVIISRGAAYVFTRHGGSYVQTAELTERATTHSPNPIESVGRAVALSSDGHIALVGADGAAFVFAASGTKYRQMAKLAAGTHDDSFGFAVALNAMGNTALVGDSLGGKQGQGVAYVFRHHRSGYDQVARLKAADGKANDSFGSSVALSADGSTTIIGAPGRAVGTKGAAGAAYVFRQAGNKYKQAAEVTANDGATIDQFGYAVAISQNGGVLLIGAPGALGSGSLTAGKGYVFDRNSSSYTQAAELTPSGSGGSAGESVALNATGTVAVLGAPNRNGNDGNPNTDVVSVGAAYVFQGSGTSYVQEGEPTAFDGSMRDYFGFSIAIDADGSVVLAGAYAHEVTIPSLPPGQNMPTSGAVYTFGLSGKLVPSDERANDLAGWSVAISATGHTAVVGAIGHTVGGNADAGAAYVFIRAGTSYVPLAELTAAHPAMSDSFGQSLAISANGREILVGAPGNKNQTGSAFIFVRHGQTFTQTQELTASNGSAGYHFGFSVALDANGDVALIGARDHGQDDTGEAYIFDRSAGTFAQESILMGKDTGSGDQFGASVALSEDGTMALAGAPLHKVGNVNMAGAAYLFTGSGRNYMQKAELAAKDGAFSDGFGTTVALSASGSTAVAGAPTHSVNATPNQGAVYVFRPTAMSHSQIAELTASDGAMDDELGSSVAVSANGQTVLAGAPFHGEQSGAAYLFSQIGSLYAQSGELLNHTQPVAYQKVGFSVALTADGATALAGGVGDPLNHVLGAAFTSTVGGALPGTFQLSSHDLSRPSSPPNKSVFGDRIRFRAVLASNYDVAGGFVDFAVGSKTLRGCGAVTLGSNGRASCVASALSVSRSGHAITATYTPNVNTASMYECGVCVASLTEVVNPRR